MKYNYIIGIDEVGRGPLAGPVTVCAAAVLATGLLWSRRRGPVVLLGRNASITGRPGRMVFEHAAL